MSVIFLLAGVVVLYGLLGVLKKIIKFALFLLVVSMGVKMLPWGMQQLFGQATMRRVMSTLSGTPKVPQTPEGGVEGIAGQVVGGWGESFGAVGIAIFGLVFLALVLRAVLRHRRGGTERKKRNRDRNVAAEEAATAVLRAEALRAQAEGRIYERMLEQSRFDESRGGYPTRRKAPTRRDPSARRAMQEKSESRIEHERFESFPIEATRERVGIERLLIERLRFE